MESWHRSFLKKVSHTCLFVNRHSDERPSPLKFKLSALADKISNLGYLGAIGIAASFLFKQYVFSLARGREEGGKGTRKRKGQDHFFKKILGGPWLDS